MISQIRLEAPMTFVGRRRDQDHLLHMELICSARHIICTDHIVLDCLVRAVLHERHMLVRCRMVYDIRMIGLENILDPLLVPHRRDQRLQVQLRIIFLQFQLYIIGVVFIDIYYDQLLRLMQRCLTADLASDRASSSSNKDDLAADIVSYFLHVEIHRLSSEKILNADISQHGDVDLLVDHLIDSRKHLDLASRLLTDIQQFSPLLVIQCRNRDDDLLDVIALRHLGNNLFPAHDRDPLQIRPDLIGIVIYDTWDFPVQMLAVLHLSYKHIPCRARSDDHCHHGFRLSGVLMIVVRDPQKAVRKSRNDNTYRKKQDINKDIASRHRVVQEPHSAELYKG